jgi:hypothetical protein
LYLDVEGIDKFIKEYDKDTKALKSELYKICWYMRGGITLSEAYELSQEERTLISKIIEDNLETTKKTGLPFF